MYKCKYCNKEFETKTSLLAHNAHCKLNPKIKEKLDLIESTRKERILICKHCNKEYKLNLTDKEFENHKYSNYCSRSCANSRCHSEETKLKISNSLKQGILEHRYILKNGYGEYDYGIKLCVCEYCKKEFKSLKYSKFCSSDCRHNSRSEKCSNLRKKEIENGTFQGWITRNIISYAEKFWIKVLENNNIPYIKEYLLQYGNLHNAERYFLDFYIELNNRKIDLEIDGKQHKYQDRIEKDKIRDKFIKEQGIEIYRIEWNEIKSKEGSLKMKEKIDKFLEFLK